MSLNTRGAKEIHVQAFEETINLLGKNSLLSERKKRLITILESGDGSLYPRDRLTEIIAGLNINGTTINANPDLKKELASFGSLENKIAYIVSLNYRTLPNSNNHLTGCEISGLIGLIRNYLDSMETELNKWTNHSQKFIIRHAALNRFNPKLIPSEQSNLDEIIWKLQNIVKSEHLDYSFHFSKETDAQKIMKIREGLRMIRNANITDDSKETIKTIFDDFKNLNDKIKPLEELDDSYTNLSAALNNMYTINRESMDVRGKSSMITSSEDIRRLKIALGVIKGNDKFNIDNYVLELLNKKQIDINITFGEIIAGDKIEEALVKSNLTAEHFRRSFLEHISQELVILAKHKLDIDKRKVFGNKKKDFDNDINSQREIQRRKIIDIGNEIITYPGNNANNGFILASYLRSNKHAFRLGENANDNQNIVRALDMAIENVCTTTPQAERELLRDSILNQNTHINELFYGDNNAFSRKDELNGIMHSTLNHARRISEQSSILSKKYGQSAMKAVIGGTAVIAGASAIASVGVGALIAGLGLAVGVKYGAKGLDKGLGKYHEWVKKERKGWTNYMFIPLKAGKLLTYPLQKLGYGIDVGSNKAAEVVGKTRTKVNGIIAGKIGSQEWIKNMSNSKVDNMFSLLAFGMNGTLRLITEGTSKVSNIGLDVLDTNEKRAILEGLYSTANMQNMTEFAEQVEIQSLIQEDLGLFEDDGYVETLSVTEKEEEKKKAKQKEFLKGMSNFKGIVENITENLKISIDGLPDKSEEKQMKKYVAIILRQMVGLLEKPEHSNFLNSINGVVENCIVTLGLNTNSKETTKYKVLEEKRDLLQEYKKAMSDARKNVGSGKGAADEAKNYSEQIKETDNEIRDLNNTLCFINHINGVGFIGEFSDLIGKKLLENPVKSYQSGNISDFDSQLNNLTTALETINTTII